MTKHKCIHRAAQPSPKYLCIHRPASLRISPHNMPHITKTATAPSALRTFSVRSPSKWLGDVSEDSDYAYPDSSLDSSSDSSSDCSSDEMSMTSGDEAVLHGEDDEAAGNAADDNGAASGDEATGNDGAANADAAGDSQVANASGDKEENGPGCHGLQD
jgi:hypothetical protein